MKGRHSFFLLFCLLPLCLLSSQESEVVACRHVLDVWKSERGLPSNSVFALAHDRAGYLWLGTWDGLVRFDGKGFRAFARANTPAFRDDLIKTLCLDRGGTLWIGSYMGDLLSLRHGEFRRHRFGERDASRPIYCLLEDRRRNLWIGTSAGLFYRPGGDPDRFFAIPGLAGKKIMGLAEDGRGRLWVGTETSGVYRLESRRWRRLPLAAGGTAAAINTLCLSRDGRIWAGTRDGLYGMRGDEVSRLTLGAGLSNNVICLHEDRRGDLWAGTENGLYRIAIQPAGLALDERAAAPGLIYSLCEDGEGSLWAGTVGGGLIQVRDARFTFFHWPHEPASGMVRCLREDGAGSLWVGGAAGRLGRFRDDRFQEVALPPRFHGHSAGALEGDASASLWLGTSGGLLRFRGGAFHDVPPALAGAGMDVRSLLRDRQGRMWAAAWGQGLACCSADGKCEWFTRASGLGDDQINCLLEDRRGRLWIGSESGVRVGRLEPGRAFRPRLELGGCRAMSAYEDGDGAVWIGTFNQGLKVRQGGRWGAVTVDQGLFDNRVYAILEDGGGRFWLTSERGIFMAGRNELLRAAFAARQRVRGRLFDESDGLSSRICNSGSPAAWKDGKGRLWFATLKGAARIDPLQAERNASPPPVRMEQVVVDKRALPMEGNSPAAPLSLAAGSKSFEFHYTALSFIRSDRIEFKYKLEGHDREWTAAGGRREAFYNDLRPGRYRFRVIAANADGVWNENGASFAFALRPFIYQTGWFMFLAALAFAALSGVSWQLLRRYLRAVSFWKKRTQIGHYRLLETIGRGGMATVYRARDLQGDGRVVALKVLREENFQDEAQKRRFRHESLITAMLDHPHIVRVYERGETGDCFYIAMELLAGTSLAQFMRARGPLPLADAVAIMRQVLDALGAIHRQQIVHRDMKPENVMICERPGQRLFVKLLDFGLAITPAQSRLTVSGVVMGTVRYLPPERIRDGVSSPAGDIYSAGIILYEMLTGCKPFWSEGTGEVIHRILDTDPLPAREINPAVPPAAEALIAAMIDKDPARRPPLRQIEKQLEELAETGDAKR
jgi:ligand-binding sensor domain-containing protein/tRNA A-37 threonylcarbamoyl transferase component Bud32